MGAVIGCPPGVGHGLLEGGGGLDGAVALDLPVPDLVGGLLGHPDGVEGQVGVARRGLGGLEDPGGQGAAGSRGGLGEVTVEVGVVLYVGVEVVDGCLAGHAHDRLGLGLLGGVGGIEPALEDVAGTGGNGIGPGALGQGHLLLGHDLALGVAGVELAARGVGAVDAAGADEVHARVGVGQVPLGVGGQEVDLQGQVVLVGPEVKVNLSGAGAHDELVGVGLPGGAVDGEGGGLVGVALDGVEGGLVGVVADGHQAVYVGGGGPATGVGGARDEVGLGVGARHALEDDTTVGADGSGGAGRQDGGDVHGLALARTLDLPELDVVDGVDIGQVVDAQGGGARAHNSVGQELEVGGTDVGHALALGRGGAEARIVGVAQEAGPGGVVGLLDAVAVPVAVGTHHEGPGRAQGLGDAHLGGGVDGSGVHGDHVKDVASGVALGDHPVVLHLVGSAVYGLPDGPKGLHVALGRHGVLHGVGVDDLGLVGAADQLHGGVVHARARLLVIHDLQVGVLGARHVGVAGPANKGIAGAGNTVDALRRHVDGLAGHVDVGVGGGVLVGARAREVTAVGVEVDVLDLGLVEELEEEAPVALDDARGQGLELLAVLDVHGLLVAVGVGVLVGEGALGVREGVVREDEDRVVGEPVAVDVLDQVGVGVGLVRLVGPGALDGDARARGTRALGGVGGILVARQ